MRNLVANDVRQKGVLKEGGGPNPISQPKFWQNPSLSVIFIGNPNRFIKIPVNKKVIIVRINSFN